MKDNTKRFAIGAMLAAGAGYLAGILTAPKSGKETRSDIKDAAIKAKHEAEKKLKTLHSELDKLLSQVKSGASKLQKSAAEEFATVVTKAQFAKQKAREMLSALHEGDASDRDLDKAIKEAEQAIEHLKLFLKNHPDATASK